MTLMVRRSGGDAQVGTRAISAPWWSPLALAAVGAVALSGAALLLPAGAVAALSVPWWVVVGILHVPFLLILLFLAGGVVERLGYLVRGRVPERPGRIPPELPHVCVQLPMYNEIAVASRAIVAAGSLVWPRHRFEVQVLDDSTDAAARAVVDAAADRVRATGVTCTVLRRDERTGYKAGALEAGRRQTDAAFLAILDADFTPQPDFLVRLLPFFFDPAGRSLPDVAVVQARWGHLNRGESALTRAQTLWIDDHHTLQMSWRSAVWRFVNFTGTAGVWRADAISRAGGWRSSSLVEDCELSFRVLFAGYRTRFVKEVVAPAELPATRAAYRAQQRRWTRGWAQLQRLHALPLLTEYRTGPLRRIHLAYHMLISWQWPLWGVWLLIMPVLVHTGLWFGAVDDGGGFLYVLPTLLWLGLSAALATVETARIDDDRSPGILTRGLARLVPHAILNTGMLPQQVTAFLEGLRGPLHAEFVRTPKTASTGHTGGRSNPPSSLSLAGFGRSPSAATWAEAFFVAYQAGWALTFAATGLLWPALIASAIALCVIAVSVRA